MSLRYLSEAEAEKRCESTLEGWIKSAGYKGCYSAEETQKAVADAKMWAAKSNTAKELMAYVETAPKEILVVGMRGGYQCFDSTGTDELVKVPVVYIDLDGRLTRFVRQPHQLHFAPEDCKELGVSAEAMDNRIALLHEFGHAKQWIERPMFFDGHFMQQTGKEAKADLRVGTKVSDPLLHPEGTFEMVKKRLKGGGTIGHNFAQAIQSRAEQILGPQSTQMYDPLINPQGGYAQSQEELADFKRVTGYSVRIEADNINRHEWPICDELGIPRRLNYRDIGGKSTAQASQTSTLLKRESQAQQAKATVQPVATSLGKSVCPKCGNLVSAITLNQDCSRHGKVDKKPVVAAKPFAKPPALPPK